MSSYSLSFIVTTVYSVQLALSTFVTCLVFHVHLRVFLTITNTTNNILPPMVMQPLCQSLSKGSVIFLLRTNLTGGFSSWRHSRIPLLPKPQHLSHQARRSGPPQSVAAWSVLGDGRARIPSDAAPRRLAGFVAPPDAGLWGSAARICCEQTSTVWW